MITDRNQILIGVLSMTLFFMLPNQGNTQHRNNNWQFGEGVGMNFTFGAPTLTSNCQIQEGFNTGCISKEDGALLFYTNGDTIWNKDHEIMVNGTGIMGVNSLNGPSIIPHPGLPDLYYVFTTDYYWPGFEEDAVMGYSIVDMEEDGGLGAVVLKNDTLQGLISDKSAATLDEDGTGYWVVFHKIWTNEFHAYHLSPFGLTATPVISTSGQPYVSALGSGEGQFQFSIEGDVLVTYYHKDDLIQLFNFDNSTGVVSGALEFVSPVTQGPNPKGIEIAPNGEKIYFTTNENFHRRLYQADVSNWDSASVTNSITLVDSATSPNAQGAWTSMELAPDGKIYMGLGGSSWLGVINDPDQTFPLCNFDPTGFDLSPNVGSGGLPIQINVFHDDATGTSEETLTDQSVLIPNPATNQLNIRWKNTQSRQLAIYDLTGRIVWQQQFNDQSLIVEVEDWPRGQYFLEEQTERGRQVSKFVLM